MTSDHGNAEQMFSESGGAHTAHTCNRGEINRENTKNSKKIRKVSKIIIQIQKIDFDRKIECQPNYATMLIKSDRK